MTKERCTVAVDAMGGDRAPGEIVAGALAAVDQLGVNILLVGREDEIRPLIPGAELPGAELPTGVELFDARDVVAMDDEPASAVRKKKDSSVVQCAQAVRDGAADAMVGAGNTGAAMAAALLRMGRIKGVARPAIAVPLPVPGHQPQLLVDGGATVDVSPEWLLQFARMGAAYAQVRLGLDEPRIGLLSNGEEAGKGDELRKLTYPLLQSLPGFVGNVEGRDLMHHEVVDVVVTDGFTGNIVVKSLEGALRSLAGLVFRVLEATPEAREAGKVLAPLLIEEASVYDPNVTGGAVLLGVKGVCVIAHGSASAQAIVGAVGVAQSCVQAGVIDRVTAAVTDAG